MKVLLLTTSYPLRQGSQSGIFIKKMVEQLPAGTDVTVLVPDDGSTQNYALSGKEKLVPFRYAPKTWQRLAHGPGGIVAALGQSRLNLLLLPPLLGSCLVMTCLLARTADVLHANWSINGAIAGIAGLLLSKPVVTTLRGSDVTLAEKSWLMRQIMVLCFRRSTFVVTVSPALKQEVVRQFPDHAGKIRVIANGIDQAFFAAHEQRVAEDGLVRFLYAGNLVAGKGVQVILEAAVRLKKATWCLDIVGDGPERAVLERFCQKCGMLGKVRFHGSVAPDQMPEVMAKADVFVFASFAEGRPNAVLEAMAAGLPVLAAAIPAVQELIADGKEGMLFPPGDAAQLAEHMEWLLTHPDERGQLGENARQQLQSLHLSWQETAEQYAALYKAAHQ